jgi:hypothetical protein
MIRRLYCLVFLSFNLLLAACGDDDAAPPTAAPGAPAVKKESTLAQKAATLLQKADSMATLAGEPNEDPEKECRILAHCEKRCVGECINEERGRAAYFKAKEQKVAGSPFDVKIIGSYLDGSCARGDDPKKRRSASGIRAVLEGTMTYTGEDLLYAAKLEGEMYLRFGADRFAEAYVKEVNYGGYYRRSKPVSRFEREVRGADPWVKGEVRKFHWESKPLSEAFCEVMPDEARVYVELATLGVNKGRVDYPAVFVNLHWEEVLGMALRQQINVLKKQKKEIVEEPADAIYSQLGKVLVTRLTGKTEWLKRSSTAQDGDITKGPAAVFPVNASSEKWKVEVAGISHAKEFGGYAHKGEDQFLVIVDISVAFLGEGEGSLKGFAARMETSPGKFQKPVTKALGQIDTSESIPSGSSVSGKLIFPRQRFERPFRLEVKTPDKNTFYLDVFKYKMGPERAPK